MMPWFSFVSEEISIQSGYKTCDAVSLLHREAADAVLRQGQTSILENCDDQFPPSRRFARRA